MSKYSQSTSSKSDSNSNTSRDSNSNISRDSNTSRDLNSLSQSMSERFGHVSKDKQCEGNRFNINLLFIGVFFLFLLTTIKSEIIPKNLFSKEKLMDSLNKIIPDAKKN
jgi:hypothetical protein